MKYLHGFKSYHLQLESLDDKDFKIESSLDNKTTADFLIQVKKMISEHTLAEILDNKIKIKSDESKLVIKDRGRFVMFKLKQDAFDKVKLFIKNDYFTKEENKKDIIESIDNTLKKYTSASDTKSVDTKLDTKTDNAKSVDDTTKVRVMGVDAFQALKAKYGKLLAIIAKNPVSPLITPKTALTVSKTYPGYIPFVKDVLNADENKYDLKIDESYDDTTVAKVIVFQSKYPELLSTSKTADGIVGPKTLSKMVSLVAGTPVNLSLDPAYKIGNKTGNSSASPKNINLIKSLSKIYPDGKLNDNGSYTVLSGEHKNITFYSNGRYAVKVNNVLKKGNYSINNDYVITTPDGSGSSNTSKNIIAKALHVFNKAMTEYNNDPYELYRDYATSDFSDFNEDGWIQFFNSLNTQELAEYISTYDKKYKTDGRAGIKSTFVKDSITPLSNSEMSELGNIFKKIKNPSLDNDFKEASKISGIV